MARAANFSCKLTRGACAWRILNWARIRRLSSCYHVRMRDLIVLLVHVITTVLRIARPGGLRSVIAESVLVRHQLLIVSRSRRRAPNLRVSDRLIAGFCSLWIKPKRLLRSAIALKPSTPLNFHRALVQRKYRLLFSPKCRAKPGQKVRTRI